MGKGERGKEKEKRKDKKIGMLRIEIHGPHSFSPM
jgi:hypothetical protein